MVSQATSDAGSSGIILTPQAAQSAFVSRQMIMDVLANPSDVRIHMQPIVDLQSGHIVGYEALSRFGTQGALAPDRWFSEAARFGLAAELEAMAITKSIALMAGLPANRFLSLNVSPNLIGTEPIQAALSGDLTGILVELTEHVKLHDFQSTISALDNFRDRGAMIAVDDTGSGYSGLQMLTKLRPQIVKLDRELVAGIDTDDVKAALARMLGDFVGLLDGWILAEGIETLPELDRIIGLGIPLAQGWVLGRPGPPFPELNPSLSRRIAKRSGERGTRDRARRANRLVMADLIDQTTSIGIGENVPCETKASLIVRIDEHLRPTELLIRKGEGSSNWQCTRTPMKVRGDDDASVILERLLLRDLNTRFEPITVVDQAGRLTGTVRMEALISALLSKSRRQDHDQENDSSTR